LADSPFPPRSALDPPASIEDMEIVLFDPGPGNVEGTPQSARHSIQVRLSNGGVELQNGNLVPMLTTADILFLRDLAARIRAKAEDAWIP